MPDFEGHEGKQKTQGECIGRQYLRSNGTGRRAAIGTDIEGKHDFRKNVAVPLV